jgi:hypothetical protein
MSQKIFVDTPPDSKYILSSQTLFMDPQLQDELNTSYTDLHSPSKLKKGSTDVERPYKCPLMTTKLNEVEDIREKLIH